jgi:hypothetical protein
MTTPRAMITLAQAGEAVSNLVKSNTKIILGSRTLGAQRQRDSRNVLMESVFNHFELVSMLAVAIDRLAVHEALTPAPSVEQGIRAFWDEAERQCEANKDSKVEAINARKIVEAVLNR